MAVVLVTGGASGIGLATVRRLAAAGDTVFSASRDPDRAGSIDGVTPARFDVCDPAAAQPLVDRIVETAGRIDAVVNNAGTGVLATVEDTTDADAAAILETNVLGPLRLVRAALPAMRKQRSGHIVNVTSLNDSFPSPTASYYSASKAALTSASHALDAEVRPFGIKVSVVAPGLFKTPLAQQLEAMTVPEGTAYRRLYEMVIASQPGRLANAGDPDKVAQAIEQCLRSDDPPFRVVVGPDAEFVEKLVLDSTPEQLAGILRSFVPGLDESEPGD